MGSLKRLGDHTQWRSVNQSKGGANYTVASLNYHLRAASCSAAGVLFITSTDILILLLLHLYYCMANLLARFALASSMLQAQAHTYAHTKGQGGAGAQVGRH
jgi:hypothetical protein